MFAYIGNPSKEFKAGRVGAEVIGEQVALELYLEVSMNT